MKKVVSSIMAAALLSLPCTSLAKDYANYPQLFWDMPNTHWAYSYVSEPADKNVISGYDDGSFRPSQTVTRAEWAKLMICASGIKPTGLENNPAADVQSNNWCYQYVCGAKDYMNFYNIDGKRYFKPEQSASREDVTVSLVKLKGYDVENVDYSYLNSFSDLDSISNNLKKYIAVAVEKGLIDGFDDGTFRGQETLSRAEAATLLCRAFQKGDDNKSTFESGGGTSSEDKNGVSGNAGISSKDLKLFFNGEELTYYVSPILENGSLYCPIRMVSEAFGCMCTWDDTTYTCTFQTPGGDMLITQVGNKVAYVNDKQIDNKRECCKIIDEFTMIDLNVFCNLFDLKVVYKGNTVNIYCKELQKPNEDVVTEEEIIEEEVVEEEIIEEEIIEDEDTAIAKSLDEVIVEMAEYVPDKFTVYSAQYDYDYDTDTEVICLTGKYSQADEAEDVYVALRSQTYGFEVSEPEDFIGKTLFFTYGSQYVKKAFDAEEYAKDYAIFDVGIENGFYYIITNYGEGLYALSSNLTLKGLDCTTPEQLVGKKFKRMVEKDRVVSELVY